MDFKTTGLHTHNKHTNNFNQVPIPCTDFEGYVGDVVPNSHGCPCIDLPDAGLTQISGIVLLNRNFIDNYGYQTADLLIEAILCTQTNIVAGGIARLGFEIEPFTLLTDIESATAFANANVVIPPSGLAESLICIDPRVAPAVGNIMDDPYGFIFNYQRDGAHVNDIYLATVYFLGVLIGCRGTL